MRALLCGCLAAWAVPALANHDVIGVSILRQFEPGLTGADVPVAQVEASGPGWQANPMAASPLAGRMTWTCADGSTTNFPNSLGAESGHANEVGRLFFSGTCGVAPGVTQMDNYEVYYFTTQIIPNEIPIPAKIVNQSFAYFARNTRVDQDYDDYASKHNVLFVSGAGNGGWVCSPGTAYNGISVAAYGGLSSVGPATDRRAKPDITAPASSTSFSTPLVSGAAALLYQGGVTDLRLLKALLLNGAQKPAGWMNSTTSPLDPRHGAGIVNIFNSWRQFRGGQLPGATARRGWDLATISSNNVRRYYFDAKSNDDRLFTFTATLTWLRHYGCTNINNLNLYLYNSDDELIASSQSAVDNVEHLYVPGLAPGQYVLEVSPGLTDEQYALAFDFGPSQPPRLQNWTLIGEPHQRYLIQATTDFKTWTPFLSDITSSAGTFDFTPQNEGGARFFRALELP